MNEITKFSNRIKISYFSYIFILVLIIILNTFYQENISILMNLPSTIIFYIFISLQSLIGVSQIIFFVISSRETYKLFSLLLKITFVLAINFESDLKCNNRICIEHNIINNNNYAYFCTFNSSYKDLIFCNK